MDLVELAVEEPVTVHSLATPGFTLESSHQLVLWGGGAGAASEGIGWPEDAYVDDGEWLAVRMHVPSRLIVHWIAPGGGPADLGITVTRPDGRREAG